MQQINYLLHQQVDKIKWDATVKASINGFLYCQAFYLDGLCIWDALVLGDYEFIMPLPRRKKMGIQYVYTPDFISQLGIVGKGDVTAAISARFIAAIPGKFKYVDVSFNEYNPLQGSGKAVLTQRNNFVLPLSASYPIISGQYSKDAQKNLRKAKQHGLRVSVNPLLKEVFTLYRQAYGTLNPHIKENDYNRFFEVCSQAIARQQGFVVCIQDPSGEVVAAGFFGMDNKRIYYLMGAPSPKGRSYGATHFLIDYVLERYAGTNLLFDFEGSDLPLVAQFYKKFNPLEKTYPHLRLNRLPFWIKWLKG